MKAPHVRLAMVAYASTPFIIKRAVDSARQLIDSAMIMIAPKAYDQLPQEGFGYCCLETKIIERESVKDSPYPFLLDELLEEASKDEIVDWVLLLNPISVVLPDSKLPWLHDSEVAAFETPMMLDEGKRVWSTGHLLRARCASFGVNGCLQIPFGQGRLERSGDLVIESFRHPREP